MPRPKPRRKGVPMLLRGVVSQSVPACSVPAGARKLTKLETAHLMLINRPEAWLRTQQIDDRDIALFNAPKLPYIKTDGNAFLKRINHLETGGNWAQTNWTPETDIECKKIVAQAGGELVGFDDLEPIEEKDWTNVNLIINLRYHQDKLPTPGADWGVLATFAKDVRVFKGPAETCEDHPWDAMILRNCFVNSTNSSKYLAERYYDILLLKMCGDFEWPWIPAAIREVSANRLCDDCADHVMGIPTEEVCSRVCAGGPCPKD